MKYCSMFEKGETIEMAGRTIRYLANDPNILKKTGKQMDRIIF